MDEWIGKGGKGVCADLQMDERKDGLMRGGVEVKVWTSKSVVRRLIDNSGGWLCGYGIWCCGDDREMSGQSHLTG